MSLSIDFSRTVLRIPENVSLLRADWNVAGQLHVVAPTQVVSVEIDWDVGEMLSLLPEAAATGNHAASNELTASDNNVSGCSSWIQQQGHW